MSPQRQFLCFWTLHQCCLITTYFTRPHWRPVCNSHLWVERNTNKITLTSCNSSLQWPLWVGHLFCTMFRLCCSFKSSSAEAGEAACLTQVWNANEIGQSCSVCVRVHILSRPTKPFASKNLKQRHFLMTWAARLLTTWNHDDGKVLLYFGLPFDGFGWSEKEVKTLLKADSVLLQLNTMKACNFVFWRFGWSSDMCAVRVILQCEGKQ